MKTLIFLLAILSPTTNAPLKEPDDELELPDDRVHNHSIPVRDGKHFNFNVSGDIAVHSASGNDITLGHTVNIEMAGSPSVDPAPELPGPCEVHIGSSDSNIKSATVSEGCACPAEINKNNWFGGDLYDDQFMVTQNEGSLKVQRKDSNGGWGMDLAFMCELKVPINCSLSSWSDWSMCSESCGGGVQRRHKHVQQEAMHGGKECDMERIEEQQCAEEKCPLFPIDCALSSWSDWSACSESCGGGVKSRYRIVLQEAIHGGKECEVERSQEQKCAEIKCPLSPIDCSLSSWNDWSACSVSCGGEGVQSRYRFVLQEAILDGKECEAGRSEEQTCDLGKCPPPDDCCTLSSWSDWSSWSKCSVTCGDGVQNRHRHVTKNSMHCEKECKEEPTEEQQCSNKEECPGCVEKFDFDTDYTGADLAKDDNVKSNDKEDCRNICRDRTECKFWTFISSWKNNCLLKYNSEGKRPQSGMVSGNVCKEKKKCLTSPGYPNNYPDNSHTEQTLSVSGQEIEITWSHFDVEAQDSCSYDYLQFKDGNGNAIFNKFCGNTSPPTLTIPTSTAAVVFHSDGTERKKGFKFCYKPFIPGNR